MPAAEEPRNQADRKSTRLNSSHSSISYAVFCLKKKSTDADFGNEFHADARARVRVLQVVDEFGEVLNRIDIVVRRRRDQSDSWGGQTHPGNPRVHFAAGQLSFFF